MPDTQIDLDSQSMHSIHSIYIFWSKSIFGGGYVINIGVGVGFFRLGEGGYIGIIQTMPTATTTITTSQLKQRLLL